MEVINTRKPNFAVNKKPKTMKKTALFALICALALLSCKGDKGDTGAAGTNGNANVQAQTFTVTVWNYNAPSYEANLSCAAITSLIENSGAVCVYAEGTPNSWTQLPVTFYQTPTYSTTLEAAHSIGNVSLSWTDSDLTQPATPPTMRFKVVVIAASVRLANPNVDYSNYNQVKTVFNLE